MVDDPRAVLPPGVAQLAVPTELPRGRSAVQRVRLWPRHSVRDVVDGTRGPGVATRAAGVRLHYGPPLSEAAACAARGVGHRGRVREARPGSEADVRLGAPAAPPGLRCLGRRTPDAHR